MLNVGIKGQAECLVTEKNTAATMGSGALQVYATPAMIALVEKAAWESVQPYLEEGCGTVGTELRVKHLAATPVGLKVWAESEVTAVEGKRIEFKVAAYDEKGLIGEGSHERFVITDERFLGKAARKLEG